MTNKYKDFKTADTLTTMSPYITHSIFQTPDPPPPPGQKWIRDELDPSFSLWCWGLDVNRYLWRRLETGDSLCSQNTKQKLFCLERFTTEQTKRGVRQSPQSAITVFGLSGQQYSQPRLETKDLGETERDRERERERQLFWAAQYENTSFTLNCYIYYKYYMCLLSASFYNWDHFLSRPNNTHQPTSSPRNARFQVTVGQVVSGQVSVRSSEYPKVRGSLTPVTWRSDQGWSCNT